MTTVKKKEILDIQAQMLSDGLDACIITSSDYHDSEYVNDHFRYRAYASGFSGSAGTLVITGKDAGLWTDSRYFLQGAQQLMGSGITLYKERESGVPTVIEFLRTNLKEGARLGVDTRTISFEYGSSLKEVLDAKGGELIDRDYASLLWQGRPELIGEPVSILEERYSGESAASKLARIRTKMQECGADMHVIASLDDIAWVLNLRGEDVSYTPVFYSYLLISAEKATLFAFEDAFAPEIREYLDAAGVVLRPYDAAMDEICSSCGGRKVLVNKAKASWSLTERLAEAELIDAPDPSELMKSVKNETECANLRRANVSDGAAMVNFLYWIKKNIGHIPMSEISASDHLEECRRRQGAVDLSFDTIAGYAEHGAIVHYSATPETDKMLAPEGLLLVDSGGHYCEGTTDITRTIALGPVTDEMKRHYTLVLRGMVGLAMAVFAKGMRGSQLDILAHGPIWKEGLTYKHGTGHGVGYLLSVHEGPQNISYSQNPRRPDVPLEPGMLTTDEPGLYIEGSHGIRIENNMLCVSRDEEMLCFETITLCPFEREAIVKEMLTAEELNYINDYHKTVYDKLSGLLDADTAAWLKEVTAPL